MKKNLAYYRTKTWNAFSIWVRTRDALRTTGTPDMVKCCTCDTIDHITNMDAGHFIAGRNNSILFVETAVHAQCIPCNRFKGGNYGAYTAFMHSRYGIDEINRLNGLKREIKRYSITDFQEIEQRYKDKLKELQ